MEDKESINGLQKRINALQRENHFLRDMLNRHNIPFEDELDTLLNKCETLLMKRNREPELS